MEVFIQVRWRLVVDGIFISSRYEICAIESFGMNVNWSSHELAYRNMAGADLL